MKRAIKVRLYPTAEQEAFLREQFGAVRLVWNKALRAMGHFYRVRGKRLSAYHDLKKLLPIAKKSRKYHWLNRYDAVCLQQSLINLDKSFKKFFDPKDKSRYPRVKKRHFYNKSYHCTGISIVEKGIILPKIGKKLGSIRAYIHRPIVGELKSITIEKSSTGKYFASILCEDGKRYPEKPINLSSSDVLGCDMGITHLLIDSKGRKQENPRFIKRAAHNLRKKQKSLSRKVKGSTNRLKACRLVAKCHERTRNAREDFQHKLSKRLVDENQALGVETLKVKNMMKNRCLSKAIADASWGKLIEKLSYKAERAGVYLVKIDQWFASSKTCDVCQHKRADLKLSDRSWTCIECGTEHDRDITAAKNVKQRTILELKAAGLSVSACGGLA
jgi:putative transposase